VVGDDTVERRQWARRGAIRGAVAGVVLGLAAALVGGCSQPPTEYLVTGKPFPDITLTRLDGTPQTLNAYRGKLVILNVWATWCGPCRRELPSLDHLSKVLDPARFAVVAMSVDSDAVPVHEYLLDNGVSLPSYIDKDARIATTVFGVSGFPDTFIIGPDGRLLAQVVGDRVWDAPKMIAALRDAGAGKPLSI
jgi:thiol-disulfide isomerase/thioredoxin